MIKKDTRNLVSNKKANINYEIIDTYEAGIELRGTEVKSILMSESSLNESYITIKNGQAYLINAHIAHYKFGNITNHDPLRERRLLLHKNEILKLEHQKKKFSYTIVPLRFYMKKNKIKLLISLAQGRKKHDKREAIKKKEMSREKMKY